ncbi:hypothetical protein [uncultured Sphingomonas sp.]|uniref:hypothetical protein n=1 Tax=uncultured Sphingomonas sp. TaxID=158754 RepID=UPI0025F04D0F|nr:hypothetical protein [uncultured Sphingomonas sp.]
MIPIAMRDITHKILKATDNSSLRLGMLSEKTYSAHSGDTMLILGVGERTEFLPAFISLLVCIDKQDASFKVYEDEADYRFMTDMLASVEINAGDIASKLEAVFA